MWHVLETLFQSAHTTVIPWLNFLLNLEMKHCIQSSLQADTCLFLSTIHALFTKAQLQEGPKIRHLPVSRGLGTPWELAEWEGVPVFLDNWLQQLRWFLARPWHQVSINAAYSSPPDPPNKSKSCFVFKIKTNDYSHSPTPSENQICWRVL